MNIFPGKYCYIGLACLTVLEFVWILIAGHTIDYSTLWPMLAGIAVFSAAFLFFCLIERITNKKRYHLTDDFADRILNVYVPISKVYASGMIYLLVGWVVLRLFNHLTMTVPIPYADAFLVRLDSYIPISWNAYFEYIARSQLLITLFDKVYTGLTILSVFAFMLLLFIGKIEHARYFAITLTITAILCTFIGMFFPALGTVEYTLENKELLNNFPYPPGLYFVDILEHLRSGVPQFFRLDALPGLTTFPSFHTATGIILVYSFRQTIYFWPTTIYTIIMIAATPIYGGHYFSDLIFGTIVAVVVCRMAETRWFPVTFRKSVKKIEVNKTEFSPKLQTIPLEK